MLSLSLAKVIAVGEIRFQAAFVMKSLAIGAARSIPNPTQNIAGVALLRVRRLTSMTS